MGRDKQKRDRKKNGGINKRGRGVNKRKGRGRKTKKIDWNKRDDSSSEDYSQSEEEASSSEEEDLEQRDEMREDENAVMIDVRARAKDEEQRQQQKEQDRLKAQAAADARALELANQPVAPQGNRGDGNFYIAFIQMGHGDCTIISTPKGQTVLVDCGAHPREISADHEFGAIDDDTYLEKISDTLYSPLFLGGLNKIDILVLTHADKDHYNHLSLVLENTVQIISCYHSDQIAKYCENFTSTWIRSHTSFIKAVTAEQNGQRTIDGNPLAKQDINNKVDRVDQLTGAIRILEEEHCKISILASNVTWNAFNDQSTPTNRGSIVLLIEVHGRKIMICGDATINTEEFLCLKYGDSIKNLDVLRVAHHGSPTSSSLSFIKTVQPQKSIVSAGKSIIAHRLPKTQIIKRYQVYQEDGKVAQHMLFSWADVDASSFTAVSDSKSVTHDLYSTGSNGTQVLVIRPRN